MRHNVATDQTPTKFTLIVSVDSAGYAGLAMRVKEQQTVTLLTQDTTFLGRRGQKAGELYSTT